MEEGRKKEGVIRLRKTIRIKTFIDYLRKQLNVMGIAFELKKSMGKELEGIVGKRHAFCWISLAIKICIRMDSRFIQRISSDSDLHAYGKRRNC